MEVAVIARQHFWCACGRQFNRGEDQQTMDVHVLNAPAQCSLFRTLMMTVGEEPLTVEQIERKFGIPAKQIALDPPVNGLYYTHFPVWMLGEHRVRSRWETSRLWARPNW